MPREILDSRVASPAGSIPKSDAPDHVRHLKAIPAPDDLEQGDLILFSATEPSFGSRRIIEAQGARYPYQDAMWHHAAVYIGNLEVCESRPGPGVRKASLGSCLSNDPHATHLLRVRRPPLIPLTQRSIISAYALGELKKRYDVKTAIKQGIGMIFGTSIGTGMQFTDAFTCAMLYYYAYFEALRTTVTTDPFLVPASLSQADTLEDVPVRWLSLT